MAIYSNFFHGSGSPIQVFDFAFCGKGNDQLGSGFYFTSSPHDALGYAGMAAERGGGEPSVHEVEIEAVNLLRADEFGLFPREKVAAIARMSPELDERLWDFGDVDYEGREKVFRSMVESFASDREPLHLIRRLNTFSSDLFGSTPVGVEAFNRAVKEVLGFDGVIEEFRNADGSIKSTHICAFFPEQIKIVSCVPAEEFRGMIECGAAPADRPRRG